MKRTQPPQSVLTQIRWSLMAVQKGSCKDCGRHEWETLKRHHIHREVSGEEGGGYDVLNCSLLCYRCHGRLHARNRATKAAA